MSKKRMTGAEILKEDMKEMEAEEKALLEDAVPKTPLEAAIDRATGFKPEDAVAAPGTDSAETGTDSAETGTETPETGTADAETDPEPPKKRDWVEEAYKCFIKDAADIDPTDPVKAVEAYFEKNATDELKAKCKSEGKDADGCWDFIEAVARKALGGREGHIDPAAVYAIAMHYFHDVPVDWDAVPKPSQHRTASEIKKENAKAKKAKKAKAKNAKAEKAKKRKPKEQQGFFFEMLEMQPGGQKPCGSPSPQASAGAQGEENAVALSAQPASTSNESEAQG
ncbi:MAG: hypothetical protein J6V72_15705 [Kiritimatiellae bacterium]|nr:hypothetical protein [Kiritimatiellia bacterium]